MSPALLEGMSREAEDGEVVLLFVSSSFQGHQQPSGTLLAALGQGQ